MGMRNDWEQFYLLQDWVLAQIRQLTHSFYLTGETALSRGYYEHRYSEDLDFFLNDAPDFQLSRDRCLSGLQQAVVAQGWRVEIILREERFGRAFVHGPIPLKLEFINDVPFRVGHPWEHPVLGLLDTKENILANKLSALLDRQEPKDLADIFWLCCRDQLDLVAAIDQAGGKAAGVFPPAIARLWRTACNWGFPEWRGASPRPSRSFAMGSIRSSDGSWIDTSPGYASGLRVRRYGSSRLLNSFSRR